MRQIEMEMILARQGKGNKRHMLANYCGKRHQFTAIVGRLGRCLTPQIDSRPWRLLQEIRNCNGTLLTDHIWILQTDRVINAGLVPGQRIAFEATVSPYQSNPKRNYALTNLRNIRPAPPQQEVM